MFGFNSTTVMPSMGSRRKNSAHSYKGLFIKDAVPIRDTMRNLLTPSPEDSNAEVITEWLNEFNNINTTFLISYKIINYGPSYERIKT